MRLISETEGASSSSLPSSSVTGAATGAENCWQSLHLLEQARSQQGSFALHFSWQRYLLTSSLQKMVASCSQAGKRFLTRVLQKTLPVLSVWHGTESAW